MNRKASIAGSKYSSRTITAIVLLIVGVLASLLTIYSVVFTTKIELRGGGTIDCPEITSMSPGQTIPGGSGSGSASYSGYGSDSAYGSSYGGSYYGGMSSGSSTQGTALSRSDIEYARELCDEGDRQNAGIGMVAFLVAGLTLVPGVMLLRKAPGGGSPASGRFGSQDVDQSRQGSSEAGSHGALRYEGERGDHRGAEDTADAASPQPGWYPDVFDNTIVRWFDGHRWTAQTAPRTDLSERT